MTQNEVRKKFLLVDGKLYWTKLDVKNQVKIGDEAGSIDNRYRRVNTGGKNHLVHRLIWLYVYGYMPKEIDHINHNRLDNRIENLREVTTRENTLNRTQRYDNTSGFTGVNWYKKYGKWVARISTDRKRVVLGYFDNKEDAILARSNAMVEHGYHPNHGVKHEN